MFSSLYTKYSTYQNITSAIFNAVFPIKKSTTLKENLKETEERPKFSKEYLSQRFEELLEELQEIERYPSSFLESFKLLFNAISNLAEIENEKLSETFFQTKLNDLFNNIKEHPSAKVNKKKIAALYFMFFHLSEKNLRKPSLESIFLKIFIDKLTCNQAKIDLEHENNIKVSWESNKSAITSLFIKNVNFGKKKDGLKRISNKNVSANKIENFEDKLTLADDGSLLSQFIIVIKGLKSINENPLNFYKKFEFFLNKLESLYTIANKSYSAKGIQKLINEFFKINLLDKTGTPIFPCIDKLDKASLETLHFLSFFLQEEKQNTLQATCFEYFAKKFRPYFQNKKDSDLYANNKNEWLKNKQAIKSKWEAKQKIYSSIIEKNDYNNLFTFEYEFFINEANQIIKSNDENKLSKDIVNISETLKKLHFEIRKEIQEEDETQINAGKIQNTIDFQALQRIYLAIKINYAKLNPNHPYKFVRFR
jgi:hypothetical protein